MRSCIIVVSAITASIAMSCTTKPPLRDTLRPLDPIALADVEHRRTIDDPYAGVGCSDLLLRPRSIERFRDDNGKEFDIGIIELSDDGHVTDDAQENLVLNRLKEVALGGPEETADPTNSPGAIVITFVHGWHHRAKVCDNNLACFRRVLYALSMAGGPKGRPVFGVYIGWRGDSMRKLSSLSFYERKSTAHLIGHDGGREVLLRLDATYRALNAKITNGMKHPVTMVTAGHSFGGALVYSALEGALVRELRSVHGVGKPASACGEQMIRPIRPGIGDLVVLVNPAFEARRYRYFAADLGTPGHYADDQLPVMLTVASTGDTAVRWWFVVGRSLYFSLFPWRLRALSDIIGAGHYDPQTTHDLVLTNNAGIDIHPPATARTHVEKADARTKLQCNLGPDDLQTCECEYPVPTDLAERMQPKQETESIRSSREALISQGSGVVPTGPDENVTLRIRTSTWDPHTPFIVARVAPEIIPQHSDIYTPRFVTFLSVYITQFLRRTSEMQPTPTRSTPCRPNTDLYGRQ